MSRQSTVFCMLAAAALLFAGGCASLPDNSGRSISHAYVDTGDTVIGKGVGQEMANHPGQSGYLLLGNGLDAFVARAVMAHTAERSIDTQYYMIHNDVVGSLFVYKLLEAADRGVRVRLLVDDIDQGGRDFGAAVLDSHPNVEVRIFNPFIRGRGRTMQYVTGFGKQTRRAHNKSFTVDNQITILGGRNIGDEYFEADPDMAFVDLDVIAAGPVAREVSASFDQYWNSSLSYPISTLAEKLPTSQETTARKQEFDAFIAEQVDSEYLSHLRHSDLANNLRQHNVVYHWGAGQVVADDPEKLTQDTSDTTYRLTKQLRPYMAGIKKELIIFSPYFVPGKSGVAFFKELRDRGVTVKVLTNSLASTDVSIVHAGYARYRERLLRMGVDLYELNVNLSPEQRKEKKGDGLGRSKFSLHAKSFVLDREKVFIGSLNLDARSVVQNTEIGVVFTSPEIANHIAGGFDREIEKVAFRLELRKEKNGREKLFWHGFVNGKAHTFDSEPHVGFWKRFGVSLMGMLPMESQI